MSNFSYFSNFSYKGEKIVKEKKGVWANYY